MLVASGVLAFTVAWNLRLVEPVGAIEPPAALVAPVPSRKTTLLAPELNSA